MHIMSLREPINNQLIDDAVWCMTSHATWFYYSAKPVINITIRRFVKMSNFEFESGELDFVIMLLTVSLNTTKGTLILNRIISCSSSGHNPRQWLGKKLLFGNDWEKLLFGTWTPAMIGKKLLFEIWTPAMLGKKTPLRVVNLGNNWQNFCFVWHFYNSTCLLSVEWHLIDISFGEVCSWNTNRL